MVIKDYKRQEYLDICERSLKKYMSMDTQSFNVDRSILMLECHIICKNNLINDQYGDNICFMCASICIDCLDPSLGPNDKEVMRKFEKIQHYIRASYQSTNGEGYGSQCNH